MSSFRPATCSETCTITHTRVQIGGATMIKSAILSKKKNAGYAGRQAKNSYGPSPK